MHIKFAAPPVYRAVEGSATTMTTTTRVKQKCDCHSGRLFCQRSNENSKTHQESSVTNEAMHKKGTTFDGVLLIPLSINQSILASV